MSDGVLYCRGPGRDGEPCGREVAGHGEDVCSSHLKQLQRHGKLSPIVEKVSAKEHLLNLVNVWAEADGDAEYAAAEKAVWSHAKAIGKSSLTPEDIADLVRQALSEATRRRQAAARARGVRIGRPAVVVDMAEALRLLSLPKVGLVARVFGISQATLYRILKRATSEKQGDCPRASP